MNCVLKLVYKRITMKIMYPPKSYPHIVALAHNYYEPKARICKSSKEFFYRCIVVHQPSTEMK